MLNQTKLQYLHNYAMTQMQHYASGLITLVELTNLIGNIKLGDVGGLTDPATGLRYP